MAQDSQHLIWIDLEMTGLSPEQDRILQHEAHLLAQGLQRVLANVGPVDPHLA